MCTFLKQNKLLVINNVTPDRKHNCRITKTGDPFYFSIEIAFSRWSIQLSSVILENVQDLIDEVYQINYIRNVPAVNMASNQHHLLGKANLNCRQ